MKVSYKTIQRVLFLLIGVLTAALLLYLWFTPNTDIRQSREADGYELIGNVPCLKEEKPDSPTGTVSRFTFSLDELKGDTTLAFRVNHQNAEAYIDGELVFSLRVSDKQTLVRTTGLNWAVIPIYRSDAGKTVTVVLEPVYENYQDESLDFYLGSELAIYRAQFMKSLPEMSLSLINIAAGLVLLWTALYLSIKKTEGGGFYALALLAISLGLWNFTQTSFASLILRDKTIFTYYVSLTMLLISAIPLVKSLRRPGKRSPGRLLELWCIVCAAACIVQLVLQTLGILDLREMLKGTHGMIIISSVVLIVDSIGDHRESSLSDGRQFNGIWLLGAGALIDMVSYYVNDSSGLIAVMLAIFIYVLAEGVRMFSSYIRQKQMLEEKETQLTLSRISVMMSQIRSHFVFNILNAISGMCKYDPEKADETVVRFARYLRNNIDIMENDKPLLFSTELSHLEDYVVLEQMRFGDKIEFCADVQTDQFMIPPLILQPVVENAIKHGLTKKPSGGTVTLRTWEEGENIKISVEDDGVGFELSELKKSSSIGLKNIRYRLRHLVNGTMDIQSRVGEGTRITITIPKKEAAV